MNTTEPKHEPSPLPKIHSVHVILQDRSSPGLICGMTGGECPLLALALRQASDLYPTACKRITGQFAPIGQDIYEVAWEYLMSIRGILHFLTASEIKDLELVWTDRFTYTFIVSI